MSETVRVRFAGPCPVVLPDGREVKPGETVEVDTEFALTHDPTEWQPVKGGKGGDG